MLKQLLLRYDPVLMTNQIVKKLILHRLQLHLCSAAANPAQPVVKLNRSESEIVILHRMIRVLIPLKHRLNLGEQHT
ncbi:hypothetical protein D3C84_1241280 [compost metagenome]